MKDLTNSCSKEYALCSKVHKTYNTLEETREYSCLNSVRSKMLNYEVFWNAIQ